MLSKLFVIKLNIKKLTDFVINSYTSIKDKMGEIAEDIKNAGLGNVDVAYRKIQKSSINFLIWRIENMNVVALPRDQYGTFYDGDSYIIYAANQYKQPVGIDTVSKEVRGGPIELHIHFWIGNNATADKSGVAAYKTVELDNYLGGAATQHREAQGNEGPRFKSYFTNGIRILSGGTESGFRKVDNRIEPKLFTVKGKRTPILTQLSDLSWDPFNSGDVFILITELNVFVWIGRAANAIEKIHGTKIATQMKVENNLRNIIFVDDGYEQGLHRDEKQDFENYLQLNRRHVMPPEMAGDDTEVEKQFRANLKLYQCQDNDGKYRVTEIKTGPLKQSDLNRNDVFILDHGVLGIWVWVGKKAPDKERFEAMRNARGFVKKKKYTNATRVTRVIDGGEPIEFKSLFLSWKDADEQKGIGTTHTVGKIAKIAVTKFDATTMHERPALAAETRLIDDGSGTVRVWRVKKNNLVEINNERHGVFFSGDCYIVWYSYKANTQKYIIYFWLGLHAEQDESGVAALKTIEKDDELGGVAVQVRVVQGREPAHFLQLFKGKMITFKGKGTDYDPSGANTTIPSDYLLQAQGTTTYSSKAYEVVIKGKSLNSNYCFVLRKAKKFYVWCGNKSTGDQREMAKNFVGKDFEIVLENKEQDNFWYDVGGKESYTTIKFYDSEDESRPARLFQLSTATGTFKSEEIFNFIQMDLIPEDVMILDAHDTIFIWIGRYSTAEEKKLVMKTAKEYLKTDPAGRDPNTPIVRLKQGYEPPTFTGFFPAWDHDLWKEHKSFMDLRMEIEGSNTTLTNGSMKKDESNFDRYQKYPISLLRAPTEKLPNKVDPQRREMHLTHDDFVSLFKMSYDQFETLPKWKQQQLKKKAEIF